MNSAEQSNINNKLYDGLAIEKQTVDQHHEDGSPNHLVSFLYLAWGLSEEDEVGCCYDDFL